MEPPLVQALPLASQELEQVWQQVLVLASVPQGQRRQAQAPSQRVVLAC
jgi:hypothetical protein